MADVEIRAFGLRFLIVLSKTQFLALAEKQREADTEPDFVGNTGGQFEIADSADEQETDLRFGFSE